MEAIDAILPVFVDYLGRFEYEVGFVETPEDVMRELLHRGVTDKRFLPGGELTVGNGQLLLKDNRERIVAERFDLRRVRDPLAFISKDQNPHQKSGYSRVVVFAEDKAGHFEENTVFHAFQCLESNPEDLVEMVQAATKANRQMARNSIDSNWISNGNDSIRSATVRRGSPSIIPQQNGGRGMAVAVPITPLVTSDTDRALFLDKPRRMYENSDNPVERYTILLNFCIEDVERFCAEVKQQQQQLQQQQQQQQRMSQQQQQPPPRLAVEVQANDFVRIFQKFKLAFNLLAYLQGHIHDPEAPELLHHLFPPLAYLVDECYDLFGEDLVRDVVSPLPTRKAVRMLTQCLTDREQVIWKALGDYWRQPRANWDGDIPSYRPIFYGGWSPGVIHLPDDDDIPDVALRRIGSDRSKKTPSVTSMDEAVVRRPVDPLGSFDEYRDELMAKKARIALVTFARERQNSRELTVVKGEYLQVLDDERKWWKCKNSEGEVGFVPHTLLKAIHYTDTFDDLEDRRKYANVKRNSSSKGRKGRHSSSSDDEDSSSRRRPPSPAPSLPPPAPPMPAASKAQPTAQPPKAEKKPMSYNHSMRSDTSMQQELKNVLDLYKQEKLNVMKTPDVYIAQDSTPHEVRNWLKAKQFSQRVLDQMAGMGGGNLFAMSRKDLIAAFGRVEGKRLDSQITISRNTTGFRTVRSTELKAILEKARRRSEKETEEEGGADNSDQELEQSKA